MSQRITPSICRWVVFTCDEACARAINAAAGVHNSASVGDQYPALIVRTWGNSEDSAVQLQVFYDGDGSVWATSVSQGDGERQWHVPART